MPRADRALSTRCVSWRPWMVPSIMLFIFLGGCSCGKTDEPAPPRRMLTASESPDAEAGAPISSTRLGTYMAGGRGLYGDSEFWMRDLERSKGLKIGIVRFNSDVWDMLEPSRGEYKWDPLDRVVELLNKEDIEIFFTFPISNKWNTPRQTASVFGHPVGPTHFPTSDLESFEKFCRAVATRYKGKIRHYEVWNEPDFPMFWKGEMEPNPAEYLPFLKIAYKAIKEIDPDATVMHGGIAMAGNTRWLDKFLELGGGDFTDCLNLHIYPAFGRYPDSIDLNLQVLARHGVKKKIWITETSTTGAYFETQDRPQEEQDKAVYLVKNYTSSLARPEVDRMFWHSLTNPGKDVRLPKDYDFGLVASDGAPLPAYTAHEIWSRLLVGSKPLHGGRLEEGARLYEFEKDGGRIVVAWSEHRDVDFFIPQDWGRARITTIDGKSQDIDPSTPSSVRIGKVPVFVELLKK